MYKIAIFVGSLRKDSINKKLAQNLIALGEDFFNFVPVSLDDVPMFNQDQEKDPPPPVVKLREIANSSDGFLFVSPEYNRSFPAVLKNVLDWGSRPIGSSIWTGKPATTCGITTGDVGTAVAQSHLRSFLTVLGMNLLSQPEIYLTDHGNLFDDQGKFKVESTVKFLRGFLQTFAKFVEKCRKE